MFIKQVHAKAVEYQILRKACDYITPYPYLRCVSGDKLMSVVSPIHGRSFVIANINNRYVVSKGNGLSYSQYNFLNTHEFGDDTWGLLLEQDAVRDFEVGREVNGLGIKTNKMEYVLKLSQQIQLWNGHIISPVLLQYDVECPYRISDAPFMTRKQIMDEVKKWGAMAIGKDYCSNYLVAADILVSNLRVLHDNEVLHNAIHAQNYTWALELLDFELSCSPSYPYSQEDDRRHVKSLFARELIQTYEVINYIAGVLQEPVDYQKIDDIYAKYGFDFCTFNIRKDN